MKFRYLRCFVAAANFSINYRTCGCEPLQLLYFFYDGNPKVKCHAGIFGRHGSKVVNGKDRVYI